ncbi:hypothetical protein H5410_021856 [Solanum commersonii]|uniref:NAC domain-containing protein n=1 Tax=Solanum commersonii TaxID=4109 RepID=A0A9J5ZF53_SOLCO|nr:hypothetical protein H5410_021856 [Solanum commersonii]
MGHLTQGFQQILIERGGFKKKENHNSATSSSNVGYKFDQPGKEKRIDLNITDESLSSKVSQSENPEINKNMGHLTKGFQQILTERGGFMKKENHNSATSSSNVGYNCDQLVMEFEEDGYRFHPRDSELFTFLLRFIAEKDLCDNGFITECDVYKHEPCVTYGYGRHCGG